MVFEVLTEKDAPIRMLPSQAPGPYLHLLSPMCPMCPIWEFVAVCDLGR